MKDLLESVTLKADAERGKIYHFQVLHGRRQLVSCDVRPIPWDERNLLIFGIRQN